MTTRTKTIRTQTLSNICRVAAERFTEHVKIFTDLSKSDQAPHSFLPTGDAAKSLADQFAQQAAEALSFAEALDDADDFRITVKFVDYGDE